MTATTQVRDAAERTGNSRALELATRGGFIGYGALHLLVGWLGVQIALGRPAAEGSQQGAFALLAAQPFGRVILSAIAVGLAAMVLWQAISAAVGHRHLRGGERVFERVASAGRAVAYAALAVGAVQVVLRGGEPAGDTQQRATSSVLAHTGGALLVGITGAAVVCLAVGLGWYGLTRRFARHLATGRMSATLRRSVGWLGALGYLAKGVAYAIVGGLLVAAAVTYDPSKSRGLDAALRTLAEQPLGRSALVAVAVGIAAFGAFGLVQARYREV